MTGFKITYYDASTEEVAASGYQDGKEWIDFYDVGISGGLDQILRVRAKEVQRIEKIS